MQVETIICENLHLLAEIFSLTNRSRSSLFSVIHSELEFKSYKIQMYQTLFKEGYDIFVQTVDQMLPLLKTSVQKTLFIFLMKPYSMCRDMSILKIVVCRVQKNYQQSLNVKIIPKNRRLVCNIFELQRKALIFFNCNVDKENYLEMLKTYFWPIFCHKCIASRIFFNKTEHLLIFYY